MDEIAINYPKEIQSRKILSFLDECTYWMNK